MILTSTIQTILLQRVRPEDRAFNGTGISWEEGGTYLLWGLGAILIGYIIVKIQTGGKVGESSFGYLFVLVGGLLCLPIAFKILAIAASVAMIGIGVAFVIALILLLVKRN